MMNPNKKLILIELNYGLEVRKFDFNPMFGSHNEIISGSDL